MWIKLVRRKLARQRVRLGVLGSGPVHEGEVEQEPEERPARLTRVETFRALQISQILMIRPDYKRLSGPLQPMWPLLQGQHQCQELAITHVIVPLCE